MDNPLGIGSSKAFEAPVVHNVAADSSTLQEDAIHVQTDTTTADNVQEVPISDIQSELHQINQVESEPANMPLQYVAPREIQQEKLPITSVHVLEAVAATTQSPFQDVMELELSAHNQGIPTTETNDVTTKSDETNVDTNDVTIEKVVNDMEISASTMPLENQNDALQHPTDVHPTLVNSNDGHILHVSSNDDAAVQILEAQIIQPLQVTTVQQQEAHTSKNIQSGLDLWARIREYDQRTAEEGFTQVLSKQQKQARKKQVLGKPPYNTRTRGGPSPSIQ